MSEAREIIERAFSIDFKQIHIDEHGDVIESFIKDVEKAIQRAEQRGREENIKTISCKTPHDILVVKRYAEDCMPIKGDCGHPHLICITDDLDDISFQEDRYHKGLLRGAEIAESLADKHMDESMRELNGYMEAMDEIAETLKKEANV